MGDKVRLKTTVTVVSPLHIGSGERLRDGVDFMKRRGQLWVVNQRKLMRRILTDAAKAGQDGAEVIRAISGMNLYELQENSWLGDEHFNVELGLFKYQLRGQTSTKGDTGELLEQMKDVQQQLYLPGSSLKGALRTVLARHGVQAAQMTIRQNDLDPRARMAAQPVEKRIFGGTPNVDLLRALQVRDSHPLPVDALGLAHVHLAPAVDNREQMVIDLEAVRPQSEFVTDIYVDEYLLCDPRTISLGLREKRTWLLNLARIGKMYAQQRLVEEIAFHKANGGTRETLFFYAKLVQSIVDEHLAADEFLLQLGWGAGWDSKTLDGKLRKQPDEFVRIVNKYRLAEGPGRGRRNSLFTPGDTFPATRKLVTMPTGGAANQPLGWVKVKVQTET